MTSVSWKQNSTPENILCSLKVASNKRIFYFVSKGSHGRKPVYTENKLKAGKPESKVVRSYDEAYLFHLFCCVNGRIPELLKLVDSFTSRERECIPKQATLYKIANENDWRGRFEEIRRKMREDLESRNGLPFTKIDQLASYHLQGTLMRAASLLREERFGDFSIKDLKALWTMQRVERGLSDSIPFSGQNQGKYTEQLRGIQENTKHKDSTAGLGFYERLSTLNAEERRALQYVLNGDYPEASNSDIPSIIAKK